jgi:hypothetical protein
MQVRAAQATRSLLPSIRTLFLLAIAAATIGPVAVVLVHIHTEGLPHFCASGAIRVLNTLAAPHVVTTLYLMLDRRQLEGVPRPALTIYLVPAMLVAACFAILLAAPPWLVAGFMLFFIFYSMWHFGRQNVGIAGFAAKVSTSRPLDRVERWTLNAATVAGVLAAYHAFAPTLMLPPAQWPFDLSALDPALSRLWYLGIALYAVVVPLSVLHLVRNRHGHGWWSAVIYLGCVGFFLPTYLSDNALFLVTSWTVAHGVQYLVMLAFHAYGASRRREGARALMPGLAFGLSLAGGVGLWLAADRLAPTADSPVAKLVIATTIALTLAHYWIDQFLWRLGNPARRAWLGRSFPFLSPCPASGARAA